MTKLQNSSIFSESPAKPKKRSKIRFRRETASWQDRAKRRRIDPVNAQTLADNAASYALCATLFPILSKLEQDLHASSAVARGALDALITAAEDSLGPDAPVMSPLIELYGLIALWQRENLIDEATLIEMLLARVRIGLQETPRIEIEDILRRPFKEAFDGLPPSLRTR